MTYTHTMLPLPAQYDQAATEKKWQAHWLAARTYAWNPETPRADSYVIDTPPPTVSGTLHMGHVFSYTQADFIARFQRMTGKNVFYPMGFDDNGLPTERLVEKTKKIRATDMSREAFIAECLGVSEEARKEFRTLFQSIALSVDWDQEYHTISDDSRRLSQASFLDLVNKNQVYRSLRPFYWDPVDQTAIAQAEIVDKELPSFQNTITFTVDGEPVSIMTTRPELLPACVALFYHPEDARYTKFKGKRATVPLFGHTVPIFEDDTVESEKGTGIMMCCTFGDDADIVKWQKHDLSTRVILNKLGRIAFQWRYGNGLVLGYKNLPEGVEPLAIETGNYGRSGGAGGCTDEWSHEFKNFQYYVELLKEIDGLKASNADPKHPGAREVILDRLSDAGLLTDKKPINHTVKTAERSGSPLEILPTQQWFVRVLDKKEQLLAKTREAEWNPEWMRLRMEQWIAGLNQDWCISRQRYFGVPFPVWYAHQTLVPGVTMQPVVFARPETLPINPLITVPKEFKIIEKTCHENGTVLFKCELVEDYNDWITNQLLFKRGDKVNLLPDHDVMDTWATSSISPQLSAHGINAETAADGNRFSKLFPADLRPQAHEIIRTWAFYTLVKSHLHNDLIPWNNLMISGWCLAEDKSKMSKSKGNVVTPVALIEERGTDAVRYWAGTSRLGQDTAFSPDLLKIGKKLVGKLWNATQFAAIHLSKLQTPPTTASADTAITETLDRWILSRLGETVAKATEAFAAYEYADALDATNQFFWADFCDNYLELIKKRVYNEDGTARPEAQTSAIRTLYYVLDGILKLYAPFVPHVTEELYSHIFAEAHAARGSLHAMGQWPLAADYPIDAQALADGRHALELLEIIRKSKSESNRSIKFPIVALTLFAATDAARATLGRVMEDVNGAGNVQAHTVTAEKTAPMTHTADEHFALAIAFAEAADAA
ncbi:MAG: valine--tRNA ligase [Pseudomonadota bacterium]